MFSKRKMSTRYRSNTKTHVNSAAHRKLAGKTEHLQKISEAAASKNHKRKKTGNGLNANQNKVQGLFGPAGKGKQRVQLTPVHKLEFGAAVILIVHFLDSSKSYLEQAVVIRPRDGFKKVSVHTTRYTFFLLIFDWVLQGSLLVFAAASTKRWTSASFGV